MDPRRLRLLLELSRLGSMHEVADEVGVSVSTVSQQLGVLAREAGRPLLEPDGRRVRLTPAGRTLARHAASVLAALEAARQDLDADAEPTGTLRVAGFATAVRRDLLPVVRASAATHPRVTVTVHEYEPLEAFDLLARDRMDLALTYDYTLAPVRLPDDLVAVPLWTTPWGLAVPAGDRANELAAYGDRAWIVNSRNTADEDVVRTLGATFGFEPRVVHRIDSLDLVEDLVAEGYGVGLMPRDRPVGAAVRVLPVETPEVLLRAFAVHRAGREDWPLLRLVLDRLVTPGQAAGPAVGQE